ncbi:OmpA family protein [Mucilaginibacter sp. Bleaf8]|uniref:OmpA family protein n=1 Tax=Mucilaginibacter sp. Bleaf8 TaxID=2834430 RepID=UPI001BD16B7F|nr:OmpA family protein [Mucilaginibacter sp. Bleaf8]MBS7565240.1 OmpA family protein [Mucilaginibacter sp. Bleaf8]
MKHNFKKAGLLLTGVVMSSKLFAQTPDTTAMSKDYVQPFSGANNFRTWSIGVHGGMMTPYTIFRGKENDYRTPNERWGYGAYVKKQIWHSLGLQANFFRGHVQGTNPADASYPYQRFESKIKYAVDISANITIANINWLKNRSVISPYVSVGGGSMAYSTSLYANGAENYTARTDDFHQFYIPLGAGVKVGLAPGINLDLGYQVNFVQGDNLDGYNYGSTNDKFAYAHAGLEFALGKRSKPQLARHNPVSSMRTEYLMSERALQIQLDQQKAQNEQLRNDLNTTNSNLARLTTDSDGDGVFDLNDKCPNTPSGTKVDGSGCPLPTPVTKVIVTEEDRRVVREAIKNLEFEFGKADIKERSLSSLDRVADILVNKNFSLKLAGHTDNVGSADANLKLSKDRAESVKAYLVSKGANPSRIEAVGYGKTQPIASNKTDAGRQKNRRVEFTLF